MKARFLLLLLLLPASVFAQDMLKIPYSIILTYTDKGGSSSVEALDLVRQDVVLPLHVRGNATWLANIAFNSSEALKGKGPADSNLDRIYITISDPSLVNEKIQNGTSVVSYVNLFQGEFKLQLGKKMNIYKTPDYSLDVTVILPPEAEKR